jgi:hypothetical protein
MKLVKILARKLDEWPEADSEYGQIESMSQAGDYRVSHYAGVRQKWRKDLDDWGGSVGDGYVPCSRFTLSELATDHATAIVTRADWEAERAKLKAPKANVDWWIRHRGGKCPVEAGTLVDVRYRSGKVNEHVKALVDSYMSGSMQTHNAVAWTHIGSANDIMAYRIHKPAEQPAPVSEEAIQVGIDAADAGKLTPIADVKARFSGEDRRLEADGWIRNDGQGCPVDQGAFVEVRHRDGCVYGGIKAGEGMATNWGISNHPEDIIWYRPDFEVYPPSYKTRQALNEAKMIRGGCEDYDPQPVSRELIAKSILHCEPYEWRDRIRELDTQRAEVESDYQRQISEITQERESLISKLAAEGLALIDRVNAQIAKCAAEHEGMDDYKNWQPGDLLECVSVADRMVADLTVGKMYKYKGSGCILDDEDCEQQYPVKYGKCFKWHSRPAT